MTEREELIKSLRSAAIYLSEPRKDLMLKAANMLEADGKQEPVAEVTAHLRNATYRVMTLGFHLEDGTKLYAAPVAQQEPVAWMIWLHGPAGLFEHKQFAELELERRNNECYPTSDRKLLPLYAAPVAQKPPLTDEQIEALGHRIATKYTHRSDPASHSYGFVRHTLIDFARAIERHGIGGGE